MTFPFADEMPRFQDATIDPTGLYRYDLRREWDSRKGLVNFVMLNPSKADARLEDPTLTRCINFAVSWGYGSLVLTNLFALRSTDPDLLRRAGDPIGPSNDGYITRWALAADLVVAAWGSMGHFLERDAEVLEILKGCGKVPHALKLTVGGSPCHPLRLSSRLRPFPMCPGDH